MRGAQTAEKPNLMLIFFKMGECSPRDDAAHAVSDKIDDYILLFIFLHVITDIVFDFLSYLFAHDSDISLGVVLV